MLGKSINGYVITKKLGEGAMGAVWRAEKQLVSTGQQGHVDTLEVAIKCLLERWFTDEVIVHRFFDEARAVIRIRHPGVAKIYDVGIHDGSPYLIMELLEGETLGHRLQRLGRFPLAHVGEVGAQIASVLEATHAARIIHRDLKPENIFLVRDEEPRSRERAKVLDFGIAKLGSQAGRTLGDYPLGTPGYMSPELWRGAAYAGAPADVYAFGCIAFQLCAGQPPFDIQSVAEACSKHTYEPAPRVRSLVPEVPAAIDDIIARALAKDPAARPTAHELFDRFSELARSRTGAFDLTVPGAGPPVPPVPLPQPIPWWRRLRTSLTFSIVAGLLVGGGGGAYVLSRPGYRAPTPTALDNAWVRVAAPAVPVVLGIRSPEAPASVVGFRPAKKITSPARSYDLQEHEVTWSEIAPWLEATHTVLPVPLPAWAKDPEARRSLPVTGVTWDIAEKYCEGLGHGAALPTEEEWEYAARGAELRLHSWGSERLDRRRTHAYLGAGAVPAQVKTSTQDRTPDLLIYDLDGNVQEWTLELWKADLPDADESWVTIGKSTTIGVLRGLPLAGDLPPAIQDETAAYRERLCASGPCVQKTLELLPYIGFRCARPVH